MDDNTAATIIQTNVRKYLAQKIYSKKLLEKFQNDEEVRLEKERQQVSEGETLVKRYKLQTEIDELETVAVNKLRRENVMATRIQRAWRDYSHTTLEKHLSQQDNTCTSVRVMNEQNDDHIVSASKNVVKNNAAQVSGSGDYDVAGITARFKRPVWEPLQNSYELSSTPKLTIRSPVSFESKYTLCFTSDLSESSGEEQDLVVNHDIPYSYDKLRDNRAQDSEEHWRSIESEGPDDLYRQSVEKKLKDLISTTNDLIFSDEFEDESFSEKDTLSDNATLKRSDTPVRSCSPESTPTKGSVVSCQRHTIHHHNNPLYSMSVSELNDFLKQIESKMKGASKELMGLLIQRDHLRTENISLHQNVAMLVRNTQRLYDSAPIKLKI